ncbi:MAG: hypothetical protein ACKV2V_03515 [Blastocatellia bacterium]
MKTGLLQDKVIFLAGGSTGIWLTVDGGRDAALVDLSDLRDE